MNQVPNLYEVRFRKLKHADLITGPTQKWIKWIKMVPHHEHNVPAFLLNALGTFGGFRFAGCCPATESFSRSTVPDRDLLFSGFISHPHGTTTFHRNSVLELRGVESVDPSSPGSTACGRVACSSFPCSSLWAVAQWELGLPVWLGDRHRPLQFYSHRDPRLVGVGILPVGMFKNTPSRTTGRSRWRR